MSSGMPELGSKISLISKADIRYEGRLFTVDPQECTIALASGKLTNGSCQLLTRFSFPPNSSIYLFSLLNFFAMPIFPCRNIDRRLQKIVLNFPPDLCPSLFIVWESVPICLLLDILLVIFHRFTLNFTHCFSPTLKEKLLVPPMTAVSH